MKPNPLIKLVALFLVPCLISDPALAISPLLSPTHLAGIHANVSEPIFRENALALQPGISERTDQPSGYLYRSWAGRLLKASKAPVIVAVASWLFLTPDVAAKARSLATWWSPVFRHVAHPVLIFAGIASTVLEVGLLWWMSPSRTDRIRAWKARPWRSALLLLAVTVVNVIMAINTGVIRPLINGWHQESALLAQFAAGEYSYPDYDILEHRAQFKQLPLGQYYLESARSEFLISGSNRLAQEWDELSKQPNIRQVLERGVLAYPEYWNNELKELADGDHGDIASSILAILKSSKSVPVRRFIEVYECKAPKETKIRLFGLLDSMVSRGLTLEQAIKITEDNVAYLHELVLIFEKPNAISGDMVRSDLQFDNLEKERTPFQFAIIDQKELWPKLSLDELYMILANTANRIDAGTHWTELFQYWLQRVHASGRPADEVLARVNHWRFSDVMQGARTQDLAAFLDAFGPEGRETILKMCVQHFEDVSYSLHWTWTTLEMSLQLKDPREIQVLVDTLHQSYDQASGKYRDDLFAQYGLVAAYLSDNGRTKDPWARQMSMQFQPPPIEEGRAIRRSEEFSRWQDLVTYIGRGELTYRHAAGVISSPELFLHYLASRPAISKNEGRDWGLLYVAGRDAAFKFAENMRHDPHWAPNEQLWGPIELYAMMQFELQPNGGILTIEVPNAHVRVLDFIADGLKARHETIVDLFESVNYHDFSVFMNEAGYKHHLHGFLDALPDAQRKSLVERYIGKLTESTEEFDELVGGIAIDTLQAIHDPEISVLIEKELRQRYEEADRKRDLRAKALYVLPLGVLAESIPHPDSWLSWMLSIYKPLNVQALTKLRENDQKYDRLFNLMPLIGAGDLDFARAAQFADDDVTYMHYLFDLESKGRKTGGFDIEKAKKAAALSLMVRVNELQTSPDAVQLAAVASFDAASLYKLLVYSEDELYAITFKRLYGHLMQQIDAQGLTRDAFLEQRVKREKFRSFIRLCARFNLLDDFLYPLAPEVKRSLLQSFVQGVEDDTDELTQAVAVADTFGMVHEPVLLNVLNSALHQEYDHMVRTKNNRGEIIYGLLVGLFGNNSVVNDAWVRQMAKKYQIPNVQGLSAKSLFNADQVNVQRYIFYESGDGDGIRSFESYMNQYKDAPEYMVTPYDTYVVVEGRHEGRRLLMYANKPNHEVDGQDAIDKALAAAKQVPTVLVHRGHNTFVQRTIDRVGPQIQMVWLGNCGGDKELAAIVAKSPNVQLFSTKETGTMHINDPVLRYLNDQLLRLDYYDWEKLWEPLEKRFPNDQDFKNYIPPNRNVAALFLKAYHQMLPKETASLTSDPMEKMKRVFAEVVGLHFLPSERGRPIALTMSDSLGLPSLLEGEMAIMRYVMAWRGKQRVTLASSYASLHWDRRSFVRASA